MTLFELVLFYQVLKCRYNPTPSTTMNDDVGCITPSKRSMNRPPVYVPLGILVVLTVLVWLFDLDIHVASMFYGDDGAWSWNSRWFIQLMYNYGTYPAVAAVVIAVAVWIASAFRNELVRHHSLAMFLVLVMLLGPGLVVNAVCKDNFGRPRPRDVEQFGQGKEFLHAWQPKFNQNGKSFPSGHAAMGFYWLCLGVFLWERNRRWSWFFLFFGLVYGSLMGFGRMAQGGHWLSDVLWSAGIIYLVAWVLYRTLCLSPAESKKA